MTRSVSLSRGSPEPRVTGQPPCLCAVLRASAGLGNSALAGPWKQARLDILQICRLGCLLNALEFFRSGTSCMAWVCRACKNNTWKPQHASESFDLMLPRQGKARRCLWSENESLETFLVSSCPHPHDERGDSHLQHQTTVVSGHSNSPSACPRACHGLDTALGTHVLCKNRAWPAQHLLARLFPESRALAQTLDLHSCGQTSRSGFLLQLRLKVKKQMGSFVILLQ